MRNPWLLVAGLMDGGAALLHLGCIVGGPSWYRFFGAGERMARLAERAPLQPALITLAIAAVLGVWGLAALSGSGAIAPLPLARWVVLGAALIYALRGLAFPWLLRVMPDRSYTFLAVSSAIVLVFAIVHAIGLWRGWAEMG